MLSRLIRTALVGRALAAAVLVLLFFAPLARTESSFAPVVRFSAGSPFNWFWFGCWSLPLLLSLLPVLTRSALVRCVVSLVLLFPASLALFAAWMAPGFSPFSERLAGGYAAVLAALLVILLSVFHLLAQALASRRRAVQAAA